MPTSSKLSSPLVEMGSLQAYSVDASAIPVDIADSSGSITTFSTTQASDSLEPGYEYAIGETLTLNSDDTGKFVGKVVQTNKVKNTNSINLSAETMMSRLATDQRCYPIYRGSGISRWEVAATLDHWSQEAGLFYDDLPGNVLAYSSMFGHDYMYAPSISLPPTEVMKNPSGTIVAPVYSVVSGRLGRSLDPGASTTISMARISGAVEPLPISVPKSSTSNRMVFTAGFVVASDRSVNFEWAFNKLKGSAVTEQFKVNCSNSSGFRLSVSPDSNTSNYATLIDYSGSITAGTPYRVYVGLRETGSTSVSYQLRVVDEATGAVVVDQYANQVSSDLRGNSGWVSSYIWSPNSGSGYAQVYGVGATTIYGVLPSAGLAVQKSLGQTAKSNLPVPGFSGDVWTSVKELLSLHKMDCWYSNGKLYSGVRETTFRAPKSLSAGTVSIQQRDQARRVEITNQNSVAVSSSLGNVFFAADTVYQVATGEVQEVLVQTEHSIAWVNDPVAVAGISPYPYKSGTGQYVITGSDGYIVSPSWWADNGGKITAVPTDKEGEIKITIKGPDFDSVRAPYRVSEGDAGRPALYITGKGVLNTPKVLQVATGNPQAAQDIGISVTSPFITNTRLAYNAAAQVALRYASPAVSLSVTEAKDGIGTPAFGIKPCGAIFKHEGNVYRTSSATQTAGNITLTTVQFNTIKAVNDYYSNATIGTTNTSKAGKSIKNATLKRLGYFTETPITVTEPTYPDNTTFPSTTTFPGGD